jgi:hypothetical protein
MTKQTIAELVRQEIERLNGGDVFGFGKEEIQPEEARAVAKKSRGKKARVPTGPAPDPVVAPPQIVLEPEAPVRKPKKVSKKEDKKESPDASSKTTKTNKYAQFSKQWYLSHCKPKAIKYSDMLKSSEFKDAWSKEKEKMGK